MGRLREVGMQDSIKVKVDEGTHGSQAQSQSFLCLKFVSVFKKLFYKNFFKTSLIFCSRYCGFNRLYLTHMKVNV